MPYFVTLEGIEGSGKSTLQKALAEFLQSLGHEVVLTREPGATPIGKAIRQLLLDPSNTNFAPLAELALFAADRAQHVAEVIEPALRKGAIVLSDRFSDSTLAYQGYGRELPLETLEQLNMLATGGLQPDLVILLDLSPELGLSRVRKRTDEIERNAKTQKVDPSECSWSRFEEQELAFHRRVRNGYLELAKKPQNRFTTISAEVAPELVEEHATKALRKLLEEPPTNRLRN